MTEDLTRLMDEPGGDELETSLLRLARGEGPSPEGRRRILAGIAAASATGAVSTTAEAAAATTSSKGMQALKWGLLGVAAVAVPAALLLGSKDDAPPALVTPSGALQAPATEVKAPEPPTQAEGPAPVSLDDLPALPEAAQPSAAAPAKQPSLAEEVAQLQKAKLALKGGDAGLALSELKTYSQRFPRPRLGAEATVVRIEALQASGDTSGARALAQRFLSKNPSSPYATRLRSLTGAP
jgi:hypothetical protein